MNLIYGLAILSLSITLIAQGYVSLTYNKFSKVLNKKRISGKEIARYILDENNLSSIKVGEVNGSLTDYYDPKNKCVMLSSGVYGQSSVASLAVASHECGHAIQDKDNFIFMRIRSRLVPLVNFSSKIGYFAILIGIIFSLVDLIYIGIALEIIILLFQLVTLPVEINASQRALNVLETSSLLEKEELKQAKKVLIAAALTYVASVATTVIEILRLLLIFTRRDD